MLKLKPKRTVVKGIGWTGLYSDGDPGWCLSTFLEPDGESSLSGDQREVLRIDESHKMWAKGDMYRVEITLKLLKNKKGKFITKRARKGIT